MASAAVNTLHFTFASFRLVPPRCASKATPGLGQFVSLFFRREGRRAGLCLVFQRLAEKTPLRLLGLRVKYRGARGAWLFTFCSAQLNFAIFRGTGAFGTSFSALYLDEEKF